MAADLLERHELPAGMGVGVDAAQHTAVMAVAFGDAAADGVAGSQIFVVMHMCAVVFIVGDGGLHRPPASTFDNRCQTAKSRDNPCHEQGLRRFLPSHMQAVSPDAPD